MKQEPLEFLEIEHFQNGVTGISKLVMAIRRFGF